MNQPPMKFNGSKKRTNLTRPRQINTEDDVQVLMNKVSLWSPLSTFNSTMVRPSAAPKSPTEKKIVIARDPPYLRQGRLYSPQNKRSVSKSRSKSRGRSQSRKKSAGKHSRKAEHKVTNIRIKTKCDTKGVDRSVSAMSPRTATSRGSGKMMTRRSRTKSRNHHGLQSDHQRTDCSGLSSAGGTAQQNFLCNYSVYSQMPSQTQEVSKRNSQVPTGMPSRVQTPGHHHVSGSQSRRQNKSLGTQLSHLSQGSSPPDDEYGDGNGDPRHTRAIRHAVKQSHKKEQINHLI